MHQSWDSLAFLKEQPDTARVGTKVKVDQVGFGPVSIRRENALGEPANALQPSGW